MDLIEKYGDLLGALIVGALLLEYGISRWQKRPFSKWNLWPLMVIAYGVRIILKL
jgi:hypothetical protein